MKNDRVKLSSSEKIAFVSNLSTMLAAGIPILEAINNLMEDSKGNVRKVLETLRDDLTEGHQVNYSLARFPKVFDKVTVNVLKASEEAGTLDVTLKDLKQNLQKQNEFNDKIKSALLYPSFIVAVFGLVLFINLIFIIPKISVVFKNLRVPLPLPTRLLIAFSDLMLKNTTVFLIAVAVIIGIFVYLFTQKRSMVLNLLFSMPLVSKLITLMDLTRFSRSLYLLLSSGLSIIASLDLCGDIVSKVQTRKVIAKSKEMILAGKTFSEGLRTAKGYIPTIMIKLVETGEKTGTLDKSMQDISDYFDYQVTNNLKTLTALLEPVMLVTVGIVVGGMMVAIIAPIYGLISQVGAH